MYLHLIREVKSKGKGGCFGCKPFCTADSACRYAYDFDDIGNRESSSERGTNSVYTSNSLNQYTAVDDFAPQFDDDGNQTLVKTATGIWQVQYNGENRPVLWRQGDVSLVMSYDRMGRRIKLVKLEGWSISRRQLFSYNGYLQVQRRTQEPGMSAAFHIDQFGWNPTEPIATRPLVWNRSNTTSYYTHDGNKNVTEVITGEGNISAHYEYSPFGALTSAVGDSILLNPWRFSSEYVDDKLGLIYYNYRHYEPLTGNWLARDPVAEAGCITLYNFCRNNAICLCDSNGLYFGWDDALTLGIGAVAGVVAQGFGDLLRGKCSGWQDYLGSAVSGALYAEAIYLSPAMGPGPVMLVGAASSGIGNIVAQGSKVLTRRQEGIDACEFVISISTGALFARIPSWNMKGVNAGRGSMLAVTRRLSIEIKNGSISSMSFKSWRKAVCATGLEFGSIYALPQNLANQGLVDLSQNGDWISEWFFTEVSIESGEGGYWYESQDWELYWMPEYLQGGDYPVWLPDGMKPAPFNEGSSW